MVLVGSNAAWAHPVLYQRLAQAKRDNPRLQIVAIDPRRTATCEIADRHLALAPGSDGGLFVGLLNALAQAGACVDGFRDGPQALAEASGWDVAKVADFCGLAADEVAGFYRDFIAAPRAITLYTMGINQSASGSDKCNAIINVHLALSLIHIYKQRIRLRDGWPCDGGEQAVRAWPVKVENGKVWVGSQQLLARAEAS